MNAYQHFKAAPAPTNLIDRIAAVLPTLTEIAETSIVLGSALVMVVLLNAML